jgi:hydrogenase maturation protease
MGDILVIGIGNRDRGDDGIGLVVASRLEAAALPGVTVIEHRGDAAGLLDLLAATDAAVLVDAAVSGAAPGTFRRIDVNREPLPTGWFTCSTHGMGVATAIALADTLASLPRRCVVYAVEGTSFAHGAPLSDAAQAAIPAVTAEIGRDIAALAAEAGQPEPERGHA